MSLKAEEKSDRKRISLEQQLHRILLVEWAASRASLISTEGEEHTFYHTVFCQLGHATKMDIHQRGEPIARRKIEFECSRHWFVFMASEFVQHSNLSFLCELRTHYSEWLEERFVLLRNRLDDGESGSRQNIEEEHVTEWESLCEQQRVQRARIEFEQQAAAISAAADGTPGQVFEEQKREFTGLCETFAAQLDEMRQRERRLAQQVVIDAEQQSRKTVEEEEFSEIQIMISDVCFLQRDILVEEEHCLFLENIWAETASKLAATETIERKKNVEEEGAILEQLKQSHADEYEIVFRLVNAKFLQKVARGFIARADVRRQLDMIAHQMILKRMENRQRCADLVFAFLNSRQSTTLKLERQRTVLQRFFCGFAARAAVGRAFIERRMRSLILIQRCGRGLCSREDMFEVRHYEAEMKKVRLTSVIIIQFWWRKFHSRRENERREKSKQKEKQLSDRFAKLQAHVRRRIEQRRYLLLLADHRKFQIFLMQRVCRGGFVRRKELRPKVCTKRLAAAVFAAFSCLLVRSKRYGRPVQMIQGAWKGHVARRRLNSAKAQREQVIASQQKKFAASRIQASWKGHRERCAISEEKRRNRIANEAASCDCITKAGRGYLSRKVLGAQLVAAKLTVAAAATIRHYLYFCHSCQLADLARNDRMANGAKSKATLIVQTYARERASQLLVVRKICETMQFVNSRLIAAERCQTAGRRYLVYMQQSIAATTVGQFCRAAISCFTVVDKQNLHRRRLFEGTCKLQRFYRQRLRKSAVAAATIQNLFIRFRNKKQRELEKVNLLLHVFDRQTSRLAKMEAMARQSLIYEAEHGASSIARQFRVSSDTRVLHDINVSLPLLEKESLRRSALTSVCLSHTKELFVRIQQEFSVVFAKELDRQFAVAFKRLENSESITRHRIEFFQLEARRSRVALLRETLRMLFFAPERRIFEVREQNDRTKFERQVFDHLASLGRTLLHGLEELRKEEAAMLAQLPPSGTPPPNVTPTGTPAETVISEREAFLSSEFGQKVFRAFSKPSGHKDELTSEQLQLIVGETRSDSSIPNPTSNGKRKDGECKILRTELCTVEAKILWTDDRAIDSLVKQVRQFCERYVIEHQNKLQAEEELRQQEAAAKPKGDPLKTALVDMFDSSTDEDKETELKRLVFALNLELVPEPFADESVIQFVQLLLKDAKRAKVRSQEIRAEFTVNLTFKNAPATFGDISALHFAHLLKQQRRSATEKQQHFVLKLGVLQFVGCPGLSVAKRQLLQFLTVPASPPVVKKLEPLKVPRFYPVPMLFPPRHNTRSQQQLLLERPASTSKKNVPLL